MILEKFEKFIKIMKLTQSDQDGEALNALRMANTILVEANVSWEELLRAKVAVTSSVAAQAVPQTGKHYTNKEEIEEMLKGVLSGMATGSSFYSFIKSLDDWWTEKGWLTEKQYNALRKSYERVK